VMEMVGQDWSDAKWLTAWPSGLHVV